MMRSEKNEGFVRREKEKEEEEVGVKGPGRW